MILTSENLHAASTSNRGYTHLQLRTHGVETPPKRGWLKRLIGTEIDDSIYAEFLGNKGAMIKPPGKVRITDETQRFYTDPELEIAPDPVEETHLATWKPDPRRYQLPPAQEKRRESPATCVQMAVPIELVETVQGLIRLRDSLANR